jgi:hypothetical protein
MEHVGNMGHNEDIKHFDHGYRRRRDTNSMHA